VGNAQSIYKSIYSPSGFKGGRLGLFCSREAGAGKRGKGRAGEGSGRSKAPAAEEKGKGKGQREKGGD
jgi:hypothetical protein